MKKREKMKGKMKEKVKSDKDERKVFFCLEKCLRTLKPSR